MMELYFLKRNALDALKNNLPQIFEKYFVEKDNSWLGEICLENPFEKFREVPDFELVPLEENFDPSTVDFRNSQILYKNLNFLTPRQASDERFWAGLCHGIFYDYVRRRWGYDKEKDFSDSKDIVEQIKTRFFFSGDSRHKIFTNTLSKYWWARYIFSDEAWDILGAKDFYTKIFSIGSRSFIGNKKLFNGFIKFLKHFKSQGMELNIKKHIRPAMSELNKKGGAIILDCLTEEEIAAIMIEHVEKDFNEKFSTKIVTETGEFIKDGDKVYATSLVGGSTKTFKVAKKYLVLYRELIGKQINSVFELNGEKWKITGIKKI